MLTFTEYCRLMTEEFFASIILGDVGTVKTLGIITAENPGVDNKLTKVGNERKNKELAADLERAGFAPVPMRGRFAGKQENPFLVVNISREKLVELAKKYRQECVIYGEKRQKLGGKRAPLFEFMLIRNGRTARRGVLGVNHPENLINRDSSSSCPAASSTYISTADATLVDVG